MAKHPGNSLKSNKILDVTVTGSVTGIPGRSWDSGKRDTGQVVQKARAEPDGDVHRAA